MSRLARLVLGVAIVLYMGLGLPAPAADPIPIDGPTVITEPGHYILTRDLTVSSGTAIEVVANGVTIDLNQFTITHTGSAFWSWAITTNAGSLRITNGTINGGAGIELTCRHRDPALFQVDRVSLVDQVSLRSGRGAITIIGHECSPCRAVIEDNTISKAAAHGVFISDCDYVRVSGNSTTNAIWVAGAWDEFNEISNNYLMAAGIVVEASTGATVRNNKVVACNPGPFACFQLGPNSGGNLLDSNTCVSRGNGIVVSWQSGPSPPSRFDHNRLLTDDAGIVFYGGCGWTYSDNRVPGGVMDWSACNIDGGGNVIAPFCEPRTRGYWHRQCLGLSGSGGGIDPGLGRGPGAALEPGFAEQLVPCTEMAGLPGCEAIEPDTASDPCARAEAQLAAVTFNKLSARLQDACGVDLRPEGCAAGTVGELIEEASGLISSGNPRDCRQASQCLAAVNHGAALTDGF